MSAQGYRILDEPRPGALSHLVVDPMWPFFALMLGGGWLGLPWFALNGLAMGSATRRREVGLVVGSLALSAVLFFGLVALEAGLGWGVKELRYCFVAVMACKLGVGYWLHTLQSRSFALYEYFGGRARNGVLGVVAGLLLREHVMGLFGKSGLWTVVAL